MIDLRNIIIQGIWEAVLRGQNISQVFGECQRKEESPSEWLDRLRKSLQVYSGTDPNSPIGEVLLKTQFVAKSREDIRRKLEKMENWQEKSLQELLKEAQKVYMRRDEENQKIQAKVLVAAVKEVQKQECYWDQDWAGAKKPVGYVSKLLDLVSRGWPTCLQAIVAVALLVEETKKSPGANPYQSLEGLREYWKEPEKVNMKWKGPDGIYWLIHSVVQGMQIAALPTDPELAGEKIGQFSKVSRNDRTGLEMAHSSRMDFYFTATQDLISILVEDPEDDQISTPKEESRKILGILGMSFILTRQNAFIMCPKILANPFGLQACLRNQQFSETPGKADESQMGTGSTRRKEGEGSDRNDDSFHY
ncbi:hypothetical protein HGM15179_018826 [Zosterops borbonicus]|uniref:Core shell protein Gag P30 domain-containing protein n=1 Tax=Zosterops borbonicus TaxID=364589 RepID=A0A8K1D9U9_9PASS|nr:hypothetical protein HGM15179_018826 [Zosterops borbonicus]